MLDPSASFSSECHSNETLKFNLLGKFTYFKSLFCLTNSPKTQMYLIYNQRQLRKTANISRNQQTHHLKL